MVAPGVYLVAWGVCMAASGVYMVAWGVCMVAPEVYMVAWGRVWLLPGAMCGKRGAVCGEKGVCMVCTPRDTAGHCMGGTHPTGMHSQIQECIPVGCVPSATVAD